MKNGFGTEIPGAYGKLFLTVLDWLVELDIGYGFCERKHSSNYLIVAIAHSGRSFRKHN
jgi:signal peptidase II